MEIYLLINSDRNNSYKRANRDKNFQTSKKKNKCSRNFAICVSIQNVLTTVKAFAREFSIQNVERKYKNRIFHPIKICLEN